jgi:hypothetical protein
MPSPETAAAVAGTDLVPHQTGQRSLLQTENSSVSHHQQLWQQNSELGNAQQGANNSSPPSGALVTTGSDVPDGGGFDPPLGR